MPSIGTVSDSFDNALAETVNGYYKTELIYGPTRPGPWKTVEDAELATLGWVHWHNTSRLHGYLDDVPSEKFEASFYATKRTDQSLVEIHRWVEAKARHDLNVLRICFLRGASKLWIALNIAGLTCCRVARLSTVRATDSRHGPMSS